MAQQNWASILIETQFVVKWLQENLGRPEFTFRSIPLFYSEE